MSGRKIVGENIIILSNLINMIIDEMPETFTAKDIYSKIKPNTHLSENSVTKYVDQLISNSTARTRLMTDVPPIFTRLPNKKLIRYDGISEICPYKNGMDYVEKAFSVSPKSVFEKKHNVAILIRCSKRKSTEKDLLPAYKRYRGFTYKKINENFDLIKRNADVYIMSSIYSEGVSSMHTLTPDYDLVFPEHNELIYPYFKSEVIPRVQNGLRKLSNMGYEKIYVLTNKVDEFDERKLLVGSYNLDHINTKDFGCGYVQTPGMRLELLIKELEKKRLQDGNK